MSIEERKKLTNKWPRVTLGEVADYHNGRAFKPEEWATSGTPIIRIQNLNTPSAGYNYFRGEASPRNAVNDGDLLISWSASLDAFLWDRGPAILNQHIFKVDEYKDKIDRLYMYFAVKEAMAEIRDQVHGATMKHITKPEFEAIRIPLPPLFEQKSIASILTEQMAAVEKARAAAEERLKAAKELPAAYLREIFDSEEGQRWPSKRLGDVLSLRNEIVHPYDKPEGKATFVGLEHLQSGIGIRSGSISVEMENLTGRKPIFYAGDIVYGYLRPYLNKVWIAEFDGLCSVDQYVYLVDGDKADARYIAWYMRSPTYLQRAPIDTSPGQLPRIRKEEVASVLIELPPIDQQVRIADQIDAKMRVIRHVSDCIVEEYDSVNKVPAALLRKAFQGEL